MDMAPARRPLPVHAALLVLVLLASVGAEDAGQYKPRDEVLVVANTVRTPRFAHAHADLEGSSRD
jgi:hypothetical protein